MANAVAEAVGVTTGKFTQFLTHPKLKVLLIIGLIVVVTWPVAMAERVGELLTAFKLPFSMLTCGAAPTVIERE
jgi:hypothetical protein